PQQDIASIAAGSPEFTILTAALGKAMLADALKGEGPFTVFAPTDAAFGSLLGNLGITAEELLDQPQLADVLLYHVGPARVLSTDLQEGMAPETLLAGQTLAISLSNGARINESSVTAADIEASNGVIHVIDAVLIPPTFTLVTAAQTLPSIVDVAVASPDFTVLTAALQKAGLVEALQGEGPFTVFAPTDAAFASLLADLGVTAGELLDQPQLADVLLYHVVPGRVLSTALSEGMAPETLLAGQSLAVSLRDGAKVNDSYVTAADIEAGNGVIHVIDAVLVPPTFQLAR
ncbi:MAG TPA: fasciclin domain-containing protein, partial [Candidatus Limnocylindria bacterium]|nr:fasciclin domain-containing protein [Candidatus Limnocylindria bacterium]